MITHVSLCCTILWSFPVLYSVPISKFSFPNSINRFAAVAIFHNKKRKTLYEYVPAMDRFGEQLQKLIEPVIRDFIDCMEPGTPQVEIESHRKTNSCLVLI